MSMRAFTGAIVNRSKDDLREHFKNFCSFRLTGVRLTIKRVVIVICYSQTACLAKTHTVTTLGDLRDTQTDLHANDRLSLAA